MKYSIVIINLLLALNCISQSHPSLMLTKKNVEAVRIGITKYPLLQSSYQTLKQDADNMVALPINVPTPADGGGGISHEQHKNNYKAALSCGILFQLSKDIKYANYVKAMMMQYAKAYNTWHRHPKRKSQPGGKIFWQNLNDCVWLVYMIQGYDCIYDYLTESERNYLTENLWTPAVNEQTKVNGAIFNLIHNFAAWSTAGVGMAGYVCGKKDWVEMALKGGNKDGKTGYFKLIDELFSPDGYYAEGPYYLRYAIHPFIVFARAIQQYQPELKIYKYRNQLLKKAVLLDLQTTYTNKVFFPINDALKDKTYETEELVYAADIVYGDIEAIPNLLDIAQQQHRVIVSDAGLKVAKAIAEGKSKPFEYKPMLIRDGADGNKGGLGVLRSGNNNNHTCLVLKAASQGMGHGHFDRLNILFYNNNAEVFSDYGAVRFLNVETKSGGGYTKENDTWAKATVAHNTLVVDAKNQFNSNADEGEKFAPSILYFNNNKNYQIVSAKEINAYPAVAMLRTVMLFKPENAETPVFIDVFKALSSSVHQYDLPFWYQGHLTNTNFSYNNNNTQLPAFGINNGYEHIWLNAQGKVGKQNGAITFLNNRKYYTTTFLSDSSTKVSFVTAGANDPNFNLRSEKAFVISQPKASNYTFINITEPHGINNPIIEFTNGINPLIKNIVLMSDDAVSTTFSFEYNTKKYVIQLQYNNKQSFITFK